MAYTPFLHKGYEDIAEDKSAVVLLESEGTKIKARHCVHAIDCRDDS